MLRSTLASKINSKIGANRGIGLGLVGAFRKRNYTVWGSIRPRSMNDDSAEEASNRVLKNLTLRLTFEFS